ncbi:SAF domain protein [Treponema phagedenis F0421]|nr:SAF domain protein [Treponema phagedenis F0421]
MIFILGALVEGKLYPNLYKTACMPYNEEHMNSFMCGNRVFSSNSVLIIAEIGTGHEGSIERAKKLIDAAVQSGADAVKFQIVYADEILHPDSGFVDLPSGRIPLYDKFTELEVPLSFYEECFSYTRSKGALFGASPFGFKSLNELISLKPDFIKIASPELNYLQLLERAAKSGFPIILSSGVSLLRDIEAAMQTVDSFATDPCKRALLHCVTSYPAPESEYNLSLVKNLSAIFGVPTGLSDHSLDPVLVPTLSVAHGACIIEKHICLSRAEGGLDDKIALEPAMFAEMVQAVRQCEKRTNDACYTFLIEKGYDKTRLKEIAGSGIKKLAQSEAANYGRTNRSLHYYRDLPAGSTITSNDIGILRTEKTLSVGESPKFYELFINSILQRDVHAGDGAVFSDIIRKTDDTE